MTPAPLPSRPLLLLVATLAPLGGCGFFGSGDSPFQLAFRGGAGYWPENSRIAVDNALALQYDGVQVDVTVTADEIPVLHRSPTLSPEVCTATTGLEFAEGEVVIADLLFEELEDQYRCGGVVNPDYPDAATAQDIITPLTYFRDAVADGNQASLVQLNIVWDKDVSLDAETTARAVLDTWWEVDPADRFFVSTSSPELIEALGAHTAELGRAGQLTTSLVWPDVDGFGGSASVDLAQTLGVADPVARAKGANADGILMEADMIDREMVRKLRAAELDVQVWGTDGDARYNAVARWPVDAILTAYPKPEPTQ